MIFSSFPLSWKLFNFCPSSLARFSKKNKLINKIYEYPFETNINLIWSVFVLYHLHFFCFLFSVWFRPSDLIKETTFSVLTTVKERETLRGFCLCSSRGFELKSNVIIIRRDLEESEEEGVFVFASFFLCFPLKKIKTLFLPWPWNNYIGF